MDGKTHLTAWVSQETKERFVAQAQAQGLSESAMLKRMIELLLQSTSAVAPIQTAASNKAAREARLTVRLRRDDQLMLQDRAAARGVPPTTYVALLVRSHLRALAPLPKAELDALMRTVAELGAVGRNLNQIARAVNQGLHPSGPCRDELRAILKACVGLRDHVRDLIRNNLKSWEIGYDEASSERASPTSVDRCGELWTARTAATDSIDGGGS